ncbi:YceI family protein [Shinella sp.]|uniref:YceI family protein n=1 Tax=Shinella sp. TaxID=1870904 RepID=UPI003F72632A
MIAKTIRVAVLTYLATTAAAFAADSYKLDGGHSTIMYSLDHLGFATSHGIFRTMNGELLLDGQNPAASRLDVAVETTSVDGFDEGRSNAVRGTDFLDVANFPEMRFVSASIERTGENEARVTGNLTLHGVTRPLTLDAVLVKQGAHPLSGAQRVGFSATGSLKRSDYGIMGFLPMVGDDVTIRIDAEFGAS